MIDSFVLLTPILVLGVIALVGFVGCDWVFGLERPPLKPVKNLVATAGLGEIALTWDENTTASEFHVRRGEAPGTDFEQDYPDAHTVLKSEVPYTDDTVTNGVTYYYRVKAGRGSEESEEASNEASATPVSPLVSFVLIDAGGNPVITLDVPPRTDFTGFAGMAIEIGTSDVAVHTLGRLVDPGNIGFHMVAIVDPAMMSQIIGSVQVDTSTGAVGRFVYAPLAMPVTLSAGATYYIVSEETPGLPFYDVTNTTVQHTGVARVLGGAFSGSGMPYTTVPNINHSYGPVDFQYLPS